MDVMAIPKDAPHPEAAMKWMTYIEDPKVSAEITNEVFYPTGNRAVRQFVTPAIEQDANVYPPEAVLNKMTLMRPQPAPIMRLENRLWAQLKSGS